MSRPTAADIETLVELFDQSDWKELHLEFGGLEIYLSKDAARRLASPAATPSCTTVLSPARVAEVDAPSFAPGSPPVCASVSAPMIDPRWVAVKAPNLGTFYRAPKPGAAPFVEVGQAVAADSELCLIEVMKLFTALRAGAAGVLRRICANDGELIEYDQVLFYIELSH